MTLRAWIRANWVDGGGDAIVASVVPVVGRPQQRGGGGLMRARWC